MGTRLNVPLQAKRAASAPNIQNSSGLKVMSFFQCFVGDGVPTCKLVHAGDCKGEAFDLLNSPSGSCVLQMEALSSGKRPVVKHYVVLMILHLLVWVFIYYFTIIWEWL